MIDETLSTGQRHPLTPVLLGVLSRTATLKALAEIRDDDGDELAPDHPLVLVALGVLSADKTLRRWLRHQTAEQAPPVTASSTHEPLGDLLR